MGGNKGGRGGRQGQVKGKDVGLSVTIDFMEAVEGINKTVKFNKVAI
jgi:DnaJ-class molecular chaperone